MNKFINEVEIQGVIGSVRENQVAEQYVYNLFVCTNAYYTSKDGMSVVDNTWHQITYWSNNKVQFEKGKWVHVKGYLKVQKWTGSDGVDRTSTIIQAKEATLLSSE